jgi:chromosome segregation ATPase
MSKNEDEHGYEEVDHEDDENEVGSDQETGTSARRDENGVRSASGSGGYNGLRTGNSTGNSRGNRRNRRKTGPQLNISLGEWTEAAKDALQQMSETERAIRTLSNLYEKHVHDIEEFASIQQQLSGLEQECRDKDEKIKTQKDGITALTELVREKDDEWKHTSQAIFKERDTLEEEKKRFKKYKENAEKRIKAAEAEQKLEQDKELDKLKSEQKQQLDQQKRKLVDENKKVITDLEVDKNRLSKELEGQRGETEEQKVLLAKAHVEYNDLRRVRDSFEKETQELKTKLKAMENEFGLECQGVEF